MAENESLDLGGSYAKRWDIVCDHVRKGASSEQVASKLEKALYTGLRTAIRQLKEMGVTLADLLMSRDSPQVLRQLLRNSQGHVYARLFADAASVSGPTESNCLTGWIDAVLDRVTDQICHRVAGSQHWSTIDAVQDFTSEVRDKIAPAVERIVKKLAEDPNWKPQAPRKGQVPVDHTAELMNESLLGAPI